MKLVARVSVGVSKIPLVCVIVWSQCSSVAVHVVMHARILVLKIVVIG